MMTNIKLPFVTTDVDRHGNVRHYYRRARPAEDPAQGTTRQREFEATYRAASKDVESPKKPESKQAVQGSFRATCEAYYASPEYKGLDWSTQAWRRRALDWVCKGHGDKPVRLLQTAHIYKMRDEKADKPGAANTFLKAMKALFKWAVKRDHSLKNVARDVEPSSKARLAMGLMLYTTGRREDAVRLGRPAHEGRAAAVRPGQERGPETR